MNHDEQVMRDALAQHSGDAPDAPGLAGAARARLDRRRRTRVVGVAAASAVAVIAGVVFAGGGPATRTTDAPAASGSPSRKRLSRKPTRCPTVGAGSRTVGSRWGVQPLNERGRDRPWSSHGERWCLRLVRRASRALVRPVEVVGDRATLTMAGVLVSIQGATAVARSHPGSSPRGCPGLGGLSGDAPDQR